MHNGLSITKPSTVRPHFLPQHAYATYFQSSSGGQNNIIIPEVATNPLLLQNCN